MKKLRTWAWAQPKSVHDQILGASWGSSYWKQLGAKKLRARHARQLQSMGLRVIPLVQVSIGDAGEQPASSAPVVH